MKCWAFDPGKTTGFAFWDTEKSNLPVKMGEIKKEDLSSFLNQIGPQDADLFVVERYLIRNTKQTRGFNHQWNDGLTLQVIGSIELRAGQIGAKIIQQNSSVMAVGAGYAGIPHDPKKHEKHHVAAIKHGFYYLVKNGVIPPIGKTSQKST